MSSPSEPQPYQSPSEVSQQSAPHRSFIGPTILAFVLVATVVGGFFLLSPGPIMGFGEGSRSPPIRKQVKQTQPQLPGSSVVSDEKPATP